jgi:hypothetical protein
MFRNEPGQSVLPGKLKQSLLLKLNGILSFHAKNFFSPRTILDLDFFDQTDSSENPDPDPEGWGH